MDIQSHQVESLLVLKPMCKSIDASNSILLKNFFTEFLEQKNTQFVLNLSEVEFMDSSGLGILIWILKYLARHKGKFAITGAKGIVSELFTLTRTDRIFEIYEQEIDAINALKLNIEHNV